MKELIERLYREQTLAPGELRTLLLECRGEDLDFLMQKARTVAQSHFGNKIYIRGLIEVGNCCHNDCLYCGIRRRTATWNATAWMRKPFWPAAATDTNWDSVRLCCKEAKTTI